MLEVIETLNRESDTTMAIITHNAVIGEMADRVVHLRDGRVEGITVPARRRRAAELAW